MQYLHQHMNTGDLQILMQVVRSGSYAAAARELGIDPSVVSRAIKALEGDLGARLFQRTTRKVSLTEAGGVFTERLAPLLEELQQARDAATDSTAEIRGTLRLSVTNTFGLSRVVPLLPTFCNAYPQLDIELMLTEAVVDLVAERIDVAVRLGVMHDSALVAVPLVKLKYRVVASPDWLARQTTKIRCPKDLEQVRCVTFALPGFRDRWLFRPLKDLSVAQEAVHIKPRAIISNGLALRECVLQGMGPSLLPDWLIDGDLASGAMVNLFPKFEVATSDAAPAAWAVYPSRSYMPAKVRVFIDFLRQSLLV